MTKALGLAAWPIVEVMEKDPSISALKKALGQAGWTALVTRLGEAPTKYLGSGFTGSAFLLPSGRVLKFTGNAELDASDVLLFSEPHANVIRIHDAFALLQNEGDKRIFGVAVVVKDAVDEVLDKVRDPELYEAAERLVGSWEPAAAPPDMDPVEADCWRLDEWIRESGRLELTPVERSLRDDLVRGIKYLRKLDLCPGDLLEMSNIGIKDGRAVFFDIMNQRTPFLTEEDIPVVWGLKSASEKGRSDLD